MIRFVIALVSVLVVSIGAVLIVPNFINWNDYKAEVTALARDALGRDVVVDGDLSLSLLPTPQLRANGIKVANVPQGSSPLMMQADGVSGILAWGPLLTGQIQVTSLVIDRPVVVLETYDDGSVNWAFGRVDGAVESVGSGGSNVGANGDLSGSVAFSSVELVGASVVYRTPQGEQFRIDDANADLVAESLEGPFSGRIAARVLDQDVILEGQVGEIGLNNAAPVRATLSLDDRGASVTVRGGLDLSTGIIFNGTVEGSAQRLGFLEELTQGALPGVLADGVEAKAKLDVDGKTASLTELEAAFGDRRVTGRIGLSQGGLTEIDADLNISRISSTDLFRAAADEGGAEKETDAAFSPLLKPILFPDLPSGIRATVSLGVDVIDHRDRLIRGTKVRAVLGEGELILNQFTLQLPHGSEASLIGTYSTPTPSNQNTPNFDGVLQISSTDLRGLMDWLGLSTGGVEGELFRVLTLDTRFVLKPSQVEVVDFSGSVDRAEITGGLTLLLQERPAFGLSAKVSGLNIDAYTAALSEVGETESGSDGTSAQDASDSPSGGFFTILDSFDANIQLDASDLTVNAKQISRLGIDATVSKGQVFARKITIGNAAGLTGTASGSLSGSASSPIVKATLDLTTRDLDQTLGLFGLDVPGFDRDPGLIKLSGYFETAAGVLSPDLSMEALGGTASISGQISPFLPRPDLDVALDISHPRALALLGFFGVQDPGMPVEAVRLQSSIKTADEGYAVNGALVALDATTGFNGVLDPLAPGGLYRGTVIVNHPDVNRLFTLLSPGYTPRAADLGPLRLATSVDHAGDKSDLSDLVLTVGDRRLEGDITVDQSGKRPRVSADLKSPQLIIDDWLPAGVAAPKGGVPVPVVAPGKGGWSREPIDFTALQALDGDLSFTSPLVAFGQQRLTGATLVTALEGGVFTLESLRGGFFDGDLSLAGALDSNATPRIELNGGVTKADLAKASAEAGAVNQLEGVIDLDYSLESSGRSEFDLVSNLGGAGLIVVSDGIVKGLDLESVSDKLKSLNRATDFLLLAQKAFSGGQTPFEKIEASFIVNKGEVITRDAVLVSRFAGGEGRATIDLPRQTVEGQAEFSLVEHPTAPPFGVRITGPLREPRQIFQLEEIQAFILQRGLGSIIEQLAPKRNSSGNSSSDGPEITPAPTQPITPPVPVKPLENLLKGLTGQSG